MAWVPETTPRSDDLQELEERVCSPAHLVATTCYNKKRYKAKLAKGKLD